MRPRNPNHPTDYAARAALGNAGSVQASQLHSGAASRRYCFIFVCQAGELEIKALLLAASLKRFLRCDYELVAAVPGPATVWGELSTSTSELLYALGVRIEAIANPIDPAYKIGNKLACLSIATNAEKIVFLDSDILCLREFYDDAQFAVAFAAKPADLRTFSASADDWRPLYAAARVQMPTLRLPTTVSNEFGLAYFNSGIIFADAGAGLGTAWIDCARAVDAEPAMRPHRHWLDQVSLAIAVHKLGLDYASLDETYNFPAHLKRLRPPLPVFCHYHWPRVLCNEPVLRALVGELVREHPAMPQQMVANSGWADLVEWRSKSRRGIFSRRNAENPEIIVTGIPGSGADVLCDLLAGFDQCMALRDPVEVTAQLSQPRPPWEIAAFLRDARGDLIAGRSIAAARPTALGSDAALYTRRALNDDFVLALKSELPMLCRLDAVKRVLPEARFVACIDNPFDTIAAWKSGDTVLRDADVTSLAGSFAVASLTQSESSALQDIAASRDAAERRAMLWWWLAQRLLAQVHGVVLLNRQDLIGDRKGSLRRVLQGLNAGRSRTLRAEPSGRTMQALDDRDRQAIRAICSQAAAELGVRCDG